MCYDLTEFITVESERVLLYIFITLFRQNDFLDHRIVPFDTTGFELFNMLGLPSNMLP